VPTLALGRELVVITSGAGAGEACTVSVALPVFPDNVADMVVVPADLPVASPLGGASATNVFDDAQVTWLVISGLLPSE
jgi:hypothetical protein